MPTSSNNSQMYNDTMVAGSKEPPPMLTPKNKKFIDAEVEAIHMILNRIGNDIYSTIDACPNAKEMWISIEQWSRFVTIFKQQKDLDNVSYHTLFDILKQHQNEVNEIHAERMARNANPLTLVAAAQNYPDDYTQLPKRYKTYTESSRQTPSPRTHATAKNKGKDIVKPPSPPS
ncbi:hypothetical protein Tco_0668508 [Tanacetum coccineum]